jgi:hypothetical protein
VQKGQSLLARGRFHGAQKGKITTLLNGGSDILTRKSLILRAAARLTAKPVCTDIATNEFHAYKQFMYEYCRFIGKNAAKRHSRRQPGQPQTFVTTSLTPAPCRCPFQ